MKRFILIASVVLVLSFASLRPAKADSCAVCYVAADQILIGCRAAGNDDYASNGCGEGLMQTYCGGGPN